MKKILENIGIQFYVILIMLTFYLGNKSEAQWSTDPTINNPICTEVNEQDDPSITSDGNGGAIITWADYRNGNYDIYAQRISSGGAIIWTTDGIVVCTQTNDQQMPAITSDGNGGAIIVWLDQRNSGNNVFNYDIYAQRIDQNGVVQWTADGVVIYSAFSSSAASPTITSDGSGGAIIVWEDQRNYNIDIYSQNVNSNGVIQWATDGVAICTELAYQRQPAITTDGSGGAIISWNDERNGSSNPDIFAQKINSSGVAQWIIDGIAVCSQTGFQFYPKITNDNYGGAYVTWADNRNGNPDIYVQRINSNGSVQWSGSPDGIALCTLINSQVDPTISGDGSGGAIITWIDNRNSGVSGSDVYGQRINSGGMKILSTDAIICSNFSSQGYPTIINSGVGGAIITWRDFRNDINGDVYASILLLPSTISGMKFNDINGNGIQDQDEPGLPNWEINIKDNNAPNSYSLFTDSLGNYFFDSLTTGATYLISENSQTGWTQTFPTNPNTYSIITSQGESVDSINFGNYQQTLLGTICGIKFNDINGNGNQDSLELGLSNWVINLTYQNAAGSVTLSDTTDENGNYCFNDLQPGGSYTVSETNQSGWEQTYPLSPGTYVIPIKSGEAKDSVNFGNHQQTLLGSICGMKFNDINGNGIQDSLELGLSNWVINLTYQNAAGSVDLSDTTDENGNYCFNDLQPGNSYSVFETQKEDWRQTFPDSTYTIILGNGEGVGNINFGNISKLDCVTPPSDMVAWWPLDEISGSTSIDLAGFNNSGTHINGPVPATAKVLGGLEFDGINNYVEVLDHAELSFGTGDFSFDAWIQTTDSAGAKDLVDKRTSSTGFIGYSFFVNDGKLSLQMADGSFTNYVSSVFVADGKWHHIAITVSRADAKGILFYLDGVDTQLGDPTLHPGSLNNNGPLRIGSQSFSLAYQFKGILDEIELFNRVLTKEEIVSIYNADAYGKCKPNKQDSCLTKAWSPLGTGINNGTNGEVWALAVIGSDLYVGGNFTTAGGNTVNHIAKWNGSSWSPLVSGSNGVNGINGTVTALTVIGTDLYAGGWFTNAGGIPAENIAKWDGTNWSALGSGLSAAGAINALASMGNNIYATSYILDPTLGGPGNIIVKWDGSNWSLLSVMDDYVSSFLVDGTNLYAGGQFTMAGTVPANRIAKWDGANWSALGLGMNYFIGGTGLEMMAGNLYAGGRFTTADNNSANYIAKWDGSNWSPFLSGINNGMNNEVEGLAVMGTDLYASGSFTTAGGVSANSVAKWNGTSWSPLGSGMNDGVWRLAVIGQDLYAGGIFTTADGFSANYIAKYSCGIPVSVDEEKTENTLPTSFKLEQNYPNPFNPTSTIRYSIPKESFVKISVFDILGREIKVLVNGETKPGFYEIVFDAKEFASGIYIYKISTPYFNQSKKMILMK